MTSSRQRMKRIALCGQRAAELPTSPQGFGLEPVGSRGEGAAVPWPAHPAGVRAAHRDVEVSHRTSTNRINTWPPSPDGGYPPRSSSRCGARHRPHIGHSMAAPLTRRPKGVSMPEFLKGNYKVTHHRDKPTPSTHNGREKGALPPGGSICFLSKKSLIAGRATTRPASQETPGNATGEDGWTGTKIASTLERRRSSVCGRRAANASATAAHRPLRPRARRDAAQGPESPSS